MEIDQAVMEVREVVNDLRNEMYEIRKVLIALALMHAHQEFDIPKLGKVCEWLEAAAEDVFGD